MSQAGIVDFIGTHPEIPILFVANVGSATPIANTLEILGTVVAAHSIPLETTGSGNTITVEVQYASSAVASLGTNAGVASFNSAEFTVDANGFVSVTGGVFSEDFQVDAFTPPGTNPVVPNGSGTVTITGGQVAAGTTTNVIRTDSLAANTYTIEIQRSQAVASSTIGDNGVSHFSSVHFSVDANGFVTLAGGGQAIDSIAVQTGTSPIVPTVAGLVTINGAVVAAGTNPVRTDGTGANTMAIEVQITQAIAATDATKIGLANFNSTYFTVDANGFVSPNGSGLGETITGNVGGALSPTAGNWNILGTSTVAGSTPVQTSGSVSTLTVQVQKTQAIASTDATKVGLAAFDSARFTVDANGFVTLGGTGVGETITGNTGGALSPTAGNWDILGSGSITTAGSGSTLTVQLTGITNHAVQVGGSGTTLTQVGPSATTGAVLASNGAAADPSFQTIASLGGITTITGNTGGAESPSAGNFNILGTGSITVAGSANTETVQLTGLTNHNVLVGAGTATITNVAPSATAGIPLVSNGSSSDPSFTTAVVAGGGTGATSFNINGAVISGTTTTSALAAVTLGLQQLLVGNTSAAPTAKSLSTIVQVITAAGAGTYTPTSGMVYCIIEVVGGGGGGGGAATAGASGVAGGAGGGAGGYSRGHFSAATIGASKSVVVGGGGAGGTAGANTGTTGTTTSVGSTLIQATGGVGGIGGSNGSAAYSQGGAGGVGSLGVVNATGGSGGSGFGTYSPAVTAFVTSGQGGASFFGNGGKQVGSVGSNSTAGNVGVAFGSGGGGASTAGSGTQQAGGDGAPGVIIITEYVLS